MGQKVSPTGFRLGITEEWRSRWYADKDYAQNLANDLAIRKFLDKQLARAAVSKVEIERRRQDQGHRHHGSPGCRDRPEGAEIDALRKKLKKVANGPVNIVRSSRSSAPSWMPISLLSPLPSSSRAASHSVAPCARPFSLLASPVPRASASSAPVVSAVPR